MTLRTASLLSLFGIAALTACSPRGGEEDAMRRGDESFAVGNYEEALAEYRLAVRQGGENPETAIRVAHTYARMGRVDEAEGYYREAAALDPTLADQAVSDLMRLALDAQRRSDRFAMATAVEAAQALRPGLGVAEMSLPLARHYFVNGEYGRALPFYQSAMDEATDSAPEIVFEVGQAYEEIGDCPHALIFFERFRAMVRPGQRGEVDWYIGSCAFSLAREWRIPQAGSVDATHSLEIALAYVDRAVEVGEPRNIQAQALFEKGEILSALFRCDEAMEAYSQVRFADQAAALVDRAQARFDEIRFGRGLEGLRGGRCR